jgi:hypothetical protein
MSSSGFEFTPFDEMVLTGDLREVQVNEEVRELRRTLKAHFANVVEMDLEEVEEPEED